MSGKLTVRAPFVTPLVVGVLLLTSSAVADSGSLAATSVAAEDLADEALDVGSDSSAAPAAQTEGSGTSPGSSKLSVHGFLTQSYATADFADPPIGVLPDGTMAPLGPSPNGIEGALGIPEDGTFDYRFLALQFRYDMSPRDVFVVQLSSRELGFSTTTEAEDEIELDWAFYERRLTDYTSLKVGRVQIPMGIFNEIRDVGTVLPFYRPPFNFYREGAFTSETVDGALLSHRFLPQAEWGLEISGYFGNWELVAQDPTNPQSLPTVTNAKDGYGYQIWVTTPLPELRFGTGLNSYNSEGEGFVPIDRTDIFFASLEGIFGPFTLRAEGQTADLLFPGIFPGTELGVDFNAWYVQVGYKVTKRFSIWAQRESDTIDQSCACFLIDPPKRDNFPEWAVAFNYAFTPTIVFKAEHHWTEASAEVFAVDFSMGFPLLVQSVLPYDEGSYWIASFSVSF